MKKVLIVEDEQMLRNAYREILSFEGYKVYSAKDGAQALRQIKKISPDLILLDIVMPNMDGLEFVQEMHRRHNLHNIKIIAFSNLSDQDKLQQMLTLGVNKFILKSSLSPKQLAEEVHGLINKT